ncbi:MAG: siderophore-iron reductase FhuF [Acidovorax sp.]
MIPLLEPIFRGPWAGYGESLICADPPPSQAVALSDWLAKPELFTAALREHARRRGYGGVKDLRPIASMWSMGYLAALLPPVAAAATLLHHQFPLQHDTIAMMLADSGLPAAFVIPALGKPMKGRDAHARYDSLVWGHLDPVFEVLHTVSGVPRKILWGNAARRLEDLLRVAASQVPGHPGVASDMDALLSRADWPAESGCRTNPLFGKRETVRVLRESGPTTIALHRQCCLYHLLPAMGYCGACPLDAKLRQGCLDGLDGVTADNA